MNSAHVKIVQEFFRFIGEGKISVSYIGILVIPLVCAAAVQFFVISKAKKRFIGFIPLIMVAFASLAAEMLYRISPSAEIIGMIYAGAALLCYVGLAIGAALGVSIDKKTR